MVEADLEIGVDSVIVEDEEVVRLLGNAATFEATFAVIPLIIFLYCSDRGRDRARPY